MTETQASLKRKLLNRAIQWLAQREQSQFELEQKLSQALSGLESELAPSLSVSEAQNLIAQLLQTLADQRLQSDERFAQSLLRRLLSKGKGPLLIRASLKQHQLPADLIETLLAPWAALWPAQASRVRCKRFGTAPPSDDKQAAKMQRFLLARGFTPSQARAAVFSPEVDYHFDADSV